ncbi:MAG: anti-sigma factor [Cryobacterium sp.]|nr:anti-sigma factor [Cryobacterium sp.]
MNLDPKEVQEVETALALAVAPEAPSPELKAKIMARIATTPQLEPHAALVEPAEEAVGPAARRAESRWFSKPLTALVAAAAAVLLFAGGTVLGVGLSADRAAQNQAESLAVLTSASDLQRASADVAGGGVATLIWSLDQRKSAILVNNLPALSSGKTYQLWYIGSSGPVSAGTFEADASATTWRVLDGAMSAGDTVGVTVEPAGGSAAPTTDPIVAIASS